jgi:hypothetical protein
VVSLHAFSPDYVRASEHRFDVPSP